MGILDAVLGSKETTGSAGIWPFLLGWGDQNVAAFPRTYTPATQYSPGVTGAPTNTPVTPTMIPSAYNSGGGINLPNYAPTPEPIYNGPSFNNLSNSASSVDVRDPLPAFDPNTDDFRAGLANWARENNVDLGLNLSQPAAPTPAAPTPAAPSWPAAGTAPVGASPSAPAPQTPAAQNPAYFDAKAYFAANPDVANLQSWSPKNTALQHWEQYGSKEGRGFQSTSVPQTEANFDAAAYLAAHPEVADPKQWSTKNTPFQHWQMYGARYGYDFPARAAAAQAAAGTAAGTTAGTQTSGGANNLGNYYYDFEKNNTIPTAPSRNSDIPGAYPSVANEILNGPPAYYPYVDVAPKSAGQTYADDLLRATVDQMLAGQGPLAQQQQAGAGALNLASQTQGLGLGLQPTFDVPTSPNGLGDFLNQYTASPNLDQVLNSAASDSARYMNEMLLPKDRAAAISGNQYGGSRSGIAEGITRRGVGEEITQMDYATRYGDYQNYLANKLSAGGQILQGDIGLANAGTNRWQAGANAQRDLLGLTGDLYRTSANANNEAFGQGLDLNDSVYKRGLMDQALQQALIDSDKARWDYGQQAPMAWLERYIQALQGAPQTPASRTDVTPGALDYAVALFGGGENSLASGIKSIFS